MVGELQIQAAAVNVEGLPQVFHAHGGAFDVPAGPAFAPRTFPGRLPRLGALPQREIAGVALAVADLDPRSRFQLFRIAIAELAVIRVAGDVEINVPCRR